MRLTLSLLLLLDAALLPAAEIGPKPGAIPTLAGLHVEAAGVTVPQAGLTQLPSSIEASAILPAAAQGPAEVGQQLQTISVGVEAALEAAGPIGAASAEDAAGAGDKVQKALEGAPAAPADEAPAAAPAAPAAPASPSGPGSSLSAAQLQRLRALKFVVSIFTEHYAPIPWKKGGRHVDFLKNYEAIRARVIAEPDMTQRQFRRMLRDYVEGAQDFHAGISFYSTEASKLPVTILSAEGRYFLFDVDRDVLPESQFPYKMGDEVVAFDGKPVSDIVTALKSAPQNVPETDERLAEMTLTARSGRKAMDVPQGKASLKIKTADGAVHDVSLDWNYQPELIAQEIPPSGDVLGPEAVPDPSRSSAQPPLRQGRPGLLASLKKMVREFLTPMAHADAALFAQAAKDERAHGMTIAAKKSFVPELGKVVWPATPREKAMMEQLPLHAYIYENEQGKKVGYIRIPDYMADDKPQAYAQLFGQLIAKFEKDTDALVIDQVNNPGGNMFYMYTLLSMLTDKPLAVPKHLMMIDQSDGKLAAQIIKQSEQPSIQDLLRRALADEMVGFQAPKEENPVVAFARYILNRLKRAQDEKNGDLRLTEPVDLFGVSHIEPQPMGVVYTKPLVVLANELDFSAADFLPAILKDNGRATIFGTRTAGAGGAVKSLQWPNQFGIDTLSYTWTLAVRTIGQVLENLGVTPDAPYKITADDLRNGFQGYKKALNDVVQAKIVSAQIAARP